MAHVIDEQVRVEDVVRAAEWYALLPKMLSTKSHE
jgi:hypothetical protein